jgi:hypothetical protein
VRGIFFILLATAAQSALASTIWNGPSTNFAPTAPCNSADPTTYDLITSDVAIARGTDFPLFNARKESSYNSSLGSPQNTTWALGSLNHLSTLIASNAFKSWGTVIGWGGDSKQLYAFLPGQTYVVHLVSDDIYLSVTFDTWGSQTFTGTILYSYARTTPAVSLPAPTVSITNPVIGAVLPAPANLTVGATASVSSGTVTKVASTRPVTYGQLWIKHSALLSGCSSPQSLKKEPKPKTIRQRLAI